MSTFILTARNDINRMGGLHIDRGQQYTININMMGITPYNLFNNNRCKDALIQQFRNNGIVVPSTDPIFSMGLWEIKMR